MVSVALDELEAQCAALQDDELTVLESIYPSAVTAQPNPSKKPGRLLDLDLAISLPSTVATHLVPSLSQPSSSSPSSLQLSHLPSISVRLFLPSFYPLSNPPEAVSLGAPLALTGPQYNWLSRTSLRAVQVKLSAMWAEERDISGEGAGILWKWWDWVANGDFLEDLGLMKNGELGLSVPYMLPPSTFHALLRTYDAAQLHSSFEATAFSCSICLENRKGKSCIKLPGCGCVFCTPCLNSCWSLAITEGTLENISCPSFACVKRRATRSSRRAGLPGGEDSGNGPSEVEPELVESVVGKELRNRWESLKDLRKAEIDPTYTICPQPKCQAAVPPPPQPTAANLAAQSAIVKRAIRLSDLTSPPTSTPSSSPVTPTTPAAPASTPADDRWERYRCCPKCNFSFCLFCKSSWHGVHTPCSFPRTSAIVQEYLSYPEGSEGRRRMEAMKGKANLERMLAKWREDEENKNWLNNWTMPCPSCAVRVEKSHGCNHMTCGRCSGHFCFRCGDSISPQDPYAHYRRPGTSCFERLFDQEEIARFERETAMGAGGIAGMQIGEELDNWREVRGFWEW